MYDVLDGVYMMVLVLTLVFAGLTLTVVLMPMKNMVEDEDGETMVDERECGGWFGHVMLMKTSPYSWPDLSVVCTSYTSCSGSAAR